jgi:hypothetical protein
MNEYNILITGGFGDLWALESWMRSIFQRATTLWWATRIATQAQPIMAQLYPKLTFVNARDKFEPGEALHDASQARELELPKDIVDLSIAIRFQECLQGLHKFQTSSLLTHTLATIKPPKRRFIVIVHDTPSNSLEHRAMRAFDSGDWKATLEHLEQHRLLGIVLNSKEAAAPPSHPLIKDLRGKLDLAQSIEYLKHSVGYWGIDSQLATLAAQLFDTDEHFKIRLRNTHARHWARIYYAPHKSQPFLVESLWRPPKPDDHPLHNVMRKLQVRMKTHRLVEQTNVMPGDLVNVYEPVADAWAKHGIAEIIGPEVKETKDMTPEEIAQAVYQDATKPSAARERALLPKGKR